MPRMNPPTPLRPSPDALAAAESLSRRNHNRVAQVRRLFIERPDVSRPTPLAEFLRGGRGGQVRLKVYLSILWLAAAPPHDVSYPSRAWATLLDLEDPAGRGARRVNEAVKWLEARDYVSVETQPGYPNRITLRSETGTGKKYSIPGAVFNKARSKGADDDELLGHRYVQLRPEFWTSGWMAVLTAPAVAMYLVLLVEQSSQPEGAKLWFSPEMASKRYSISDDSRSKGLDELRRAGLIETLRKPVASDVFDVLRFRNAHVIDTLALKYPAEVPPK